VLRDLEYECDPDPELDAATADANWIRLLTVDLGEDLARLRRDELATTRLPEHGTLHAFTIIARDYAPFARVLARSFHAQHPDGRFSVFVVDGWRGAIDPTMEPFELLGPEDVSGLTLPTHGDVYELSAAVRPRIMRHLIDRAGAAVVLYLDPDTKIYSSLLELGRLATRRGVAAVPNAAGPGLYQLGVVAVSRSGQVDEAHAEVVDDPGYGVASWNLDRREIVRSADDYLVDGHPLRFIHFRGYDPSAPQRHWPQIRELCDDYRLDLLEAGFRESPYPPMRAPRRRGVARRMLDLQSLIRGLRLTGADNSTIAREVMAAIAAPRAFSAVQRRLARGHA
jgi:hypothetical protein